MLSSAISRVDFSTFFKFLVTALLVGAAAVRLVRDTASRYLTVGRLGDDAGQRGPQEAGRVMAVAVNGVCFVCRRPSTKKCSRSVTCQSKDWNAGHKMKCNQAATTNDANLTSTSGCKRQTRGLEDPDNAGSLLPARGICRTPKKPRKVLFPYEEFVELFNWNRPGLLPCGLLNCGNRLLCHSLIVNCLVVYSIVYLVQLFCKCGSSMSCINSTIGSRNDWCFLCELQTHVHRVRHSVHPFSPINILSRIPNIGGNLGYGKQEDAHEFMRSVFFVGMDLNL
ncbi:Ubiquitin carboxyl-terminal hydrolase 19 [Nymphaea thermarum]|nr:Ubiquitin carboxyl-terminal hydrolase 19 [Nymphaea thermarum]